MIAQFAAALRESEARERAEQERRRARKTAAEQLAIARAELDRAIAEVRRAQRTRSGIAEADAAWKAAKARVIELETGAAPTWAPAAGDEHTADDAGSDDGSAGDDPTETQPNPDDVADD